MKAQQFDHYSWLAEKFEVLRTTQPDGTVAFIANHGQYDYDDLMSLFETYEAFEQDISDTQRQRLIGDALRSAARAGAITAEALRREVSTKKTAYQKHPKTSYIIVTSLSMKRPPELRRLSFDGARFTFSDSLPKAFSRNGIAFHDAAKPPQDFPVRFTKVRVSVEARSESDAYDAAFASLDYLRGIWNFIINRRFTRRWHSGPVRPVNSIHPGPVHTLHRPSGELATNTYWYEAVYPPESKAQQVKDWPKVAELTGVVRNILKHHSYPNFMRDTFIRYTRSLDGIDHESSFLKAWSLLEGLTGINESQNYGDVINRVLFLFEDEDYHRRILEHLRLRRNASIHKGKTIVDAEPLIYQLKLYVEWLIRSHLVNRRRFESPQQYGQMLNSPRDLNQLERTIDELGNRVKLLKKARKVWQPKKVTQESPGK